MITVDWLSAALILLAVLLAGVVAGATLERHHPRRDDHG